VGGIDPRGAACSTSRGRLKASIFVRALCCGGRRGVETTESGAVGGAEAGKGGSECSFALTQGRRWGSRSHNPANPGIWGFCGAKLDGTEFSFFDMGSDEVSRVALFFVQTRKTVVIMRMEVRCGVC
jgi:hypothetical protein